MTKAKPQTETVIVTVTKDKPKVRFTVKEDTDRDIISLLVHGVATEDFESLTKRFHEIRQNDYDADPEGWNHCRWVSFLAKVTIWEE